MEISESLPDFLKKEKKKNLMQKLAENEEIIISATNKNTPQQIDKY